MRPFSPSSFPFLLVLVSGSLHKLQGLSWLGALDAWELGQLRGLNVTSVLLRDLSDILFYDLYAETVCARGIGERGRG